MGQIRKINDVYFIEFYARGLLYSQIAGSDLSYAKRLLQEIEAKISGGEALTITRHIELVDFFERYISELTSQAFGKVTIQRFSSTIKHFTSFLQKDFPQIHRLDQLTPVIIEAYKRALTPDQDPKIVNLTILLLREALEYGIKLGFINDNPTLHVRLLPWSKVMIRKETDRYNKVRQLLSQRVSLNKISQLLKISDIGRLLYFSNLIPLSREDAYV